jgi:TolB-like protein/Tfp pilus assembly protein PilF
LNAKGECLACLLRGGLDEGAQDNGAAAPRQSEAATGYVFGDFEIARREDGSFWELGAGAMGVTYRATDKVLHRTVALKVIETTAAAGNSQAVRERFLREARAAAALKHPNVAGIFQFGASPEIDRCYYAMELVEGETLEALVRRDGPLKVELALEIALQVTRALVGAAAQGLVHRDLKPGNIMLAHSEAATAEMEVKVIDFGLAKATNAAAETDLTHGGFVGTPSFASPEQFGSAPADARSDIYSLGVTLWYALTGRVPYPGKTIEEIRDRQQKCDLPVEQLAERKIPAPLIDMLRRTLALDPTHRPASAREMLAALESCRSSLAMPQAFIRRDRVRKLAALIVTLAIVAAIPVAFLLWRQQMRVAANAATPLAEKSIAVLPLENLSADKENAFFADGIQDDILTSLAKISDLKVISRTSVSRYRGAGGIRNLRDVARELGVENILEGSVRREGNRVLVNVQLIDARNDRHLWAERYDRTLADSIGLQGEVAAEIAAALRAKLAPEEKASLAARPTDNPEAYALYLKALGRERALNRANEDLIAAEQLYAQAIALDPKFAIAYARLSIVQSQLGYDAPDDRRVRARAAADEALRLAPSLGEAHTALGLSMYWGDKDYAAALKEFSVAAATSPNEPDILHYIAGIQRRQGRWRESLATYERAQDLDPRNRQIIILAAFNHLLVRDWPGATACYNRALEIAPDSAHGKVGLAYLEVFQNSNPAPGRKILQSIPSGIDPDGMVTSARWDLAMMARDYSSAEKILTDFPQEDFPKAGDAPKTYYQGRLALARGDIVAAQRYFAAAIPGIEKWVHHDPNDPNRHAQLGLLYACVHRKEDAIREGRRAVEMEPESQNAFHGANRAANLALIYALVSEPDQAITLIERLLSTPGPIQWPDFPYNITLADLRLRWEWDSLRGNPRFQRILAGPEPKTVLTAIPQATPVAPEKSIAVLPFENLSAEKNDAFFADGIQDDVLTSLATIKELKVISHTSVMAYRDAGARNTRQIGETLGVANVLEGSVRRIGDRVAVNVQLIDTRTDRHLWAKHYDRTLTDSLGLQGELANEIATALRATLSPEEKVRIEGRPTNSVPAYDAYLRGRAFAGGYQWDRSNVEGAIRSYQEAVELDPSFALAWAHLSCAQSRYYWQGFDPSPARLAAAKDVVDHTLALDPNLPETHLALGYYRYYGPRDFTGALAEFQRAEHGLPNNADVITAIGLIQRRVGHWDDAIASLRHAVELDPRNIATSMDLGTTYRVLRRFPEALATADRVLAWERTNTGALEAKVGVFWATGDLRAVEPLLANPGIAPLYLGVQALFERRYAAATDVLSKALAGKPYEERKSLLFRLGLSQQRAGNVAAARATYQQAAQDLQRELKKVALDSFQEAELRAGLGRAYAGLGEAASAIAEGQKAMAMRPTSKDPFEGPVQEYATANIYALLGDADHAIPILKRLLQRPYSDAITPALLRIDPIWDQIRNDPRFQQLAEGKKS